MSEAPAVSKIPLGPKKNVFVLVDNSANVDKRNKNIQSHFTDDCGAWDSGKGSTKKSS